MIAFIVHYIDYDKVLSDCTIGKDALSVKRYYEMQGYFIISITPTFIAEYTEGEEN